MAAICAISTKPSKTITETFHSDPRKTGVKVYRRNRVCTRTGTVGSAFYTDPSWYVQTPENKLSFLFVNFNTVL